MCSWRTLSATRCWCLQCAVICSSRTNSAALHCRGGSTFTATISAAAAAAAPLLLAAASCCAAVPEVAVAALLLALLLLAPALLPALLLLLVSALLLGSRSPMRHPYTTPNEPAG